MWALLRRRVRHRYPHEADDRLIDLTAQRPEVVKLTSDLRRRRESNHFGESIWMAMGGTRAPNHR